MRPAVVLLIGLVVVITACSDSPSPVHRVPEAVSDLRWCDDRQEEPYTGPFSASDCKSAYSPAFADVGTTTVHIRFQRPASEAELGQLIVDRYRPNGKRDGYLILERGLRAFDYPLGEDMRFFPLQRETGDPVISVWIGDGGDRFFHAGDLPFGALFKLDGGFWAIGNDEAAGSWRATLFELRENAIQELGDFRVSNAGQQNCAVSPSPALTEAKLYPAKVDHLCFTFSENALMPRAYRDRNRAIEQRPH